MSPNRSRYYTDSLILIFCALLATQVFYIYRGITTPSTIAAITYRNNIPAECEIVKYDQLIKEISDYMYKRHIKTGKKIIVLADFSASNITLFIPSYGKPEDAVINHIRTLLMNHLRIGPKHGQPCYNPQQYAMAGSSKAKNDTVALPFVSVEIHNNNTGMKILDWIALVFNLGMLGYLTARLIIKKGV